MTVQCLQEECDWTGCIKDYDVRIGLSWIITLKLKSKIKQTDIEQPVQWETSLSNLKLSSFLKGWQNHEISVFIKSIRPQIRFNCFIMVKASREEIEAESTTLGNFWYRSH